MWARKTPQGFLGVCMCALALLAACAPVPQRTDPAQAAGQNSKSQPAPEGEISLNKNFYLIIDASGSMQSRDCAGEFPSRADAAKWAVKEFATKSVPQEVNLGLYVFDSSGARERVELGKDNRDRIISEIEKVRANGGTPLNASIKHGVQMVVAQKNKQLGYGEFYVVVATDGEATDGDMSGSVGYAAQAGVPIITIGFCLAQNHPLSRHSLSYRSANDPAQLLAALQETQGESSYFDQTTFQRN